MYGGGRPLQWQSTSRKGREEMANLAVEVSVYFSERHA